MIFKAILWYALLKGGWKGLKKAPPMTLNDFDLMLKQYFIDPIRKQLNQSTHLFARLPDGAELYELPR